MRASQYLNSSANHLFDVSNLSVLDIDEENTKASVLDFCYERIFPRQSLPTWRLRPACA